MASENTKDSGNLSTQIDNTSTVFDIKTDEKFLITSRADRLMISLKTLFILIRIFQIPLFRTV